MIRRTLLLTALAVPLLADIASFENVEFHDRNVETGKVHKRDGMLHLDRDTGVLVFTSENRVYVTIPSRRIEQLSYNDRNDRQLLIKYNDARERVRDAEFKLKSGNRENILNVLNSETNNKLVRIGKK